MRSTSLIAASALGLLLAGCAGPTLVGSWTTNVKTMGRTLPLEVTMSADGTWSGKMKTEETQMVAFTLPPQEIDAKGTYKLDGDALTFSASEAKIMDPPPLIQGVVPGIEKSIVGDLNGLSGGKVKFNGNDQVDLFASDGNALATFSRKKS